MRSIMIVLEEENDHGRKVYEQLVTIKDKE